MKKIQTLLTTFSIVAVLAGCTSTAHQIETRVTQDNYRQVELPIEVHNPTAEPMRTWMGDGTQYFYSEETQTTPIRVTGDQLNVMVLSGGGANGAFGVGFINGLYEQDKLDDYSIVTGISAGALMAPFVFVGGEEIPKLKNTILGLDDKMVLGKKNFLNAIFKDALSKGDSFMSYIAKVYDEELIEKIAIEHDKGRRILIGTTQFDSDELVIWNLGQIAASDSEHKVDLIHQILAASSSIPGVFPPQFIDVNYKGQKLEELHVDGGLSAQMFLQAVDIDFKKINQALGLKKKPQVHVVRNGMFKMPYETVEDKGVNLLSRTLKSMTTLQSRGDLYRMMYYSEIQGFDLQFTYIADDVSATKTTKKMFDHNYMNSLYQYGYLKAQGLTPWTQDVPF
ncbi:patatin-like phospholipase family protein [Vibrio aestuarianus]|uniref:patatin-like phospholipase family protein n=1 Tax=Vibrio aestuarianus TaxID=28171 RepID=UPI00237D2F88|nr:patatin-like phospholipase family protein [Vibrio aestuarianus]MDE1351173.1 patatin-like phospholipase family protein [Vibrio aestuarianus]